MTESKELRQLTQKLKDNQESINISRVPIKTKRAFVKLAKEEFCNDFGFTLKWLMEGLVDYDAQLIFAEIEDLKRRLLTLENRSEKPEQRTIRKLDGSRIEVNRK